MTKELLIGNSFSGAIRDLMAGKVKLNEIVCVIAGTNYATAEALFEGHWNGSWEYNSEFKGKKDQLKELTEALWPRIVQPKLWGVAPHIGSRPRWINANVCDANVRIHEGHWNTGRNYSHHGQRIAAQQLEDGRVAFVDIDRHISGVTTLTFVEGDNLESFVTDQYDLCNYVEFPSDKEMRELERRLKLEAAHAASLHTEGA